MRYDWRDFKARNGGDEGARAAFERACESIIRKIHPDAQQVRANPGDDGVDIYVGAMGAEPIDVYQCKFHLETIGDSQKAQIRSSFQTAVNSQNFKMKKWVLCIPKVLDIAESTWWSGFRIKSLEQVTEVNLLNGDQLLELASEHGLIGMWFEKKHANKIVHLPFISIGSLFKGRESSLTSLHGFLSGSASTAVGIAGKSLHGLGGVGKTRLAVEYAWKYSDGYTAILFVTADSPQNLRSNLALLAGPTVLNLNEQNEPLEEVRFAAVLRWLVNHPGWLLILDNVDSEESAIVVEQLLSKLRNGHTLITSRLARWSNQVQCLELDVLSLESAAEFLIERTEPSGSRGRNIKSSDSDDAHDLAKVLGGLALALEQAAAYIVARRKSICEYIRLWREHDRQVQDWHDPRQMQYPRSVATTWETTLEQLSDDERTLLNIMAWFDAEPIPLAVFASKVLTEQLSAQAFDEHWNEVRIETAIANLANFSMAYWSGNVVAVHSVVQAIVRTRQENKDLMLKSALVLLANAIPKGNPGDVRTWPKWEPVRAHVQFATSMTDDRNIKDPTSELLDQLGVFLHAKGLHNDAEQLIRRALAIYKESYGAEHPKYAIALNNLANVLQVTNRLSEAVELYQNAISILESQCGPDNPDLAKVLNNIALLFRDTDRFSDAKAILRKVVRIHNNVTTDPGFFAATFNNLALILQSSREFGEAEELMRRALTLAEQAFGSSHPNVAVGLNNIATLLLETGRMAEAVPILERALEIHEVSYGTDHPQVAISLNNLAIAYQRSNRFVEAESLLRRAIVIEEQSFGPEHPRLAKRLNNLGELLRGAHKLSEAEQMLRKALAINEKALGAHHSEVALIIRNLTPILYQTNRSKEAEYIWRRHLEALVAFGAARCESPPDLEVTVQIYMLALSAIGKSDSEIEQIITDLLK